jgi:undecaprenyl diphosphate synthase
MEQMPQNINTMLENFDVPMERRPRHIAVIMDGNGRWARQRGMARIEGHRHGAKSIRRVLDGCKQLGIECLTLYCFSSENWKRPEDELNALMELLREYMINERDEIMKENIRLSVIGRRDGIPEATLTELDRTVEMARKNTGPRLCLAINYGARGEIVDAVRSIVTDIEAGKLTTDMIDEQTLSEHLYTADLPDPDLLIRTAGEMRLSNFLLWQISYAEVWVTEKNWPDFDEALLCEAVRDFAARERRFGGLND